MDSVSLHSNLGRPKLSKLNRQGREETQRENWKNWIEKRYSFRRYL